MTAPDRSCSPSTTCSTSPASTASTAIIDHLLRWVPANLRVVIAARVVPPLRLQRLRLEDRLTYLAHDELAFTAEESLAAVRAGGLDLDRGTVDAIHQATGGWPAGVRMAILASRHNRHPERALAGAAARPGARRVPRHRGARLSAARPAGLRARQLSRRAGLPIAHRQHPRHDHRGVDARAVRGGGALPVSRRRNESRASGTTGTRSSQHTSDDVSLPSIRTAPHDCTRRPPRGGRLSTLPVAIGHALTAGDGETASSLFADGWLELLPQGAGGRRALRHRSTPPRLGARQ